MQQDVLMNGGLVFCFSLPSFSIVNEDCYVKSHIDWGLSSKAEWESDSFSTVALCSVIYNMHVSRLRYKIVNVSYKFLFSY